MTQLLDTILQHYTWQGIALLAVLFVLFIVQLYYYLGPYNRIYKFRLMRRKKRSAENPPISVIVVVRGENEHFLYEELPQLLHQQYDSYEVVVVYVGGDTDYHEQLQAYRNTYFNLRITKIGGNERIYISTKQALNIGIKSAQYDNLLFTVTGATPRTDMWVATMAKGFERGSVVVASSVPHFEKGTKHSSMMRLVELHHLRNAMARAIMGDLYYAPRSNYGFTRQLYDETRGYNHLAMDIGENDLYLQEITSAQRVAVVLTRNAVTIEERPERWSEWIELMRYYATAEHHYPTRIKSFTTREIGSRVLFFMVLITAIAVLPMELKIAAAILAFMRYIFVVWSSNRTAKRLGERGIIMGYWRYDLFGPIVEFMVSRPSHNTPSIWR